MYTEYAASATLIPQSLFELSLHVETGFINFKGCCPFKFYSKKHISGSTVKKDLAIDTTFDPL
jgi:hypothetical protein